MARIDDDHRSLVRFFDGRPGRRRSGRRDEARGLGKAELVSPDLLQLDHQNGGARRLIAFDPDARHDGRLREIDDDPRPAGREQAIPIGSDHSLALLAVLSREMKGDFGEVDDDAVRAFHQLGVGLDRLRQGNAKLREFAFDFGRHRGRHDAGSRLGETSGPVLGAQISSSRGGERR